jgi:hypothetical protein
MMWREGDEVKYRESDEVILYNEVVAILYE